MKEVLRSWSMAYVENHSSLTLRIPAHLLPAARTASSRAFRSFCPEGDSIADDVVSEHEYNCAAEAAMMHIDKRTGHLSVPGLAVFGTWAELREALRRTENLSDHQGGPIPSPFHPYLLDDATSKLLKQGRSESVPVDSLTNSEFVDVLGYFALPSSLSPRVFAHFDIRVSLAHDELFVPIQYPSQRNLTCGAKRISKCALTGKVIEENFGSHKRESEQSAKLFPFIFGISQTGSAGAAKETVVLVPSVLDALVVKSKCEMALPLVLGEACSTFPPEHLPYFENFGKVCFWFSRDSVSQDQAQLFAKKLNVERCFAMRRDYSAPLDCAKEEEEDVKMLIETQFRPLAHKHITNFANIREDVLDELRNSEQAQGEN